MAFQNVPGSSITGLTSYTPTFTGFGTPTNVNFTYMRFFNLLFIQGKFTNGTGTAVEARISLPTGYTTASTLPTITGVGWWTGYGAVSGSNLTVLAEPSVTYLTFGAQDSGSSGYTKKTGSTLIANSTAVSFNAFVPIVGDPSLG